MLLKSGLLDPGSAALAWESYTKRVDLQKINYASTSLLPKVYANLKNYTFNTKASLEGLKICKSVYRKTWMENHYRWSKIQPTLKQLSQAGVEKIVLLKGMAMILGSYRDFGVRVLGDIDILIPRAQLSQAQSILNASGWTCLLRRLNPLKPGLLDRWHSANFSYKEDLNLDLHWGFLLESTPNLNQSVLRLSIPLENTSLSIPHPTHQLMQTCIHGTKQSPVPLIRWICDAAELLKQDIAWDKLLSEARSEHLTYPLTLSLRYLAQHFDLQIPKEALQMRPIQHLERLEQKAKEKKRHYLAAWYRYCIKQRAFKLVNRLAHVHRYLQYTASLKAAWHIPFYAIYWIGKRLINKIQYIGLKTVFGKKHG